MNLDKKALAGFIKEIEDSRTRQKAETEYQREVFSRARKANFDVKAMRIVLQRRAMEPGARDEQDYNVHAYELALGGLKDAVEAVSAGMSVREAARANGVPRAAVAALATGSKNTFSEPHDPATGEVHESSGNDGDAPVAVVEAVVDAASAVQPAAPLDAAPLDIPPFLRRTRAA